MGAGHGIGIKRNDYHRRNRKANISMHSHKHSRNKADVKVRIIKYKETCWTNAVADWNEAEAERERALLNRYYYEEEEEEIDWMQTLSSLDRVCLIYARPILPSEDIRRRRFESGSDCNDHWWEWEKELGLKSEIKENI